ncbi:glycosyltransferase involved in cell wall biosynthesis [Kushneria sinocarnis]|uniref:Glycosyltransferase involved in cell wall biosynthesis n=1 Tax=Kushneria sinocarnis TaxID=595502 RepID=A0A420WW88_9GAMM|nr:glycosyltransferase family 2 protein [Kushneria sinocarnis]RKR03362.1 glycosyltransferase involved in cell wall biosynthesis [Kushneria sinocarnis]
MNITSGADEAWLTVGIAAYNNADHIRAAIDSVVRQTDHRVRIIVVNDGSSDETAHRIQSLITGYAPATRERILVIDQPNAGVATVRNMAIERATTPFLTFLDGDDYWLERYYPRLEALIGDVDELITGDVDLIEFNALADPGLVATEDWSGDRLMRFNALGNYRGLLTPTQLERIFTASEWYVWTRIYRTRLFDNLRFPVSLHFEDMMLIPRVYLRAREIIATDEALIAYRINPQGQARNTRPRDLTDIGHIIELHLEIAGQGPDYQNRLMTLLACQDALYYKTVANRLEGYLASLPKIRQVVRQLRPLRARYALPLPSNTRLLMLSPLASNLCSWLRRQRRGFRRRSAAPPASAGSFEQWYRLGRRARAGERDSD